MLESRILIVDDSNVILHAVSKLLKKEGFVTYTANSGEEALNQIAKRGLPHMALVDINMPGMDGFELCERLHKFSDLPVIMITTEDSEETVVEGLQFHAEDYVVKPIRPKELLARVQRVLRRMGDYNYTLDPLVTVDQYLQINISQRQAIIAGQPTKLTPNEAKFLYLLMKYAGRTVTTEYILRRLWPLEEAFEDRLHAVVYRLRKKLEPDPKNPVYIVADWSKGYQFPAAEAVA